MKAKLKAPSTYQGAAAKKRKPGNEAGRRQIVFALLSRILSVGHHLMVMAAGLRAYHLRNNPPLQITTPAECEALLGQEFAVIFKHSNACLVSRHALRTVLRFHSQRRNFPVHLISVIDFPTLSQFIAVQTGVRHESPQILALRRGKVFAYASHWDITTEFLMDLQMSRRGSYAAGE